MTDRRLFVAIEVENNAGVVFREIGQSAKQAAKDVVDSGQRAQQGIERIEKAADGAEKKVENLGKTEERAAKSAEQLEKAQEKAAKAAEEMAQHSAKAASSLDKYKSAISQTQQGLALLGTAFTIYANQAREHELAMMAVDRIYGQAADSYVDLANRIQSTTIFSNDEALEAARLMGTLRENYDLTDQQIQQLITTSADLAAMHGYTLSDAAMRVASAIRGEAESAEMLGLTMNQASIDAEGLTLTMSNAEAAQFRFNAMMQQTASSVGFAAEAAEGAAGKTRQFANEFQDAMIAAVNFTGPVGDAASALTAFGLEGGAALGGIVQLTKGINDARIAMGGIMPLLGAGGIGIGLVAAAVAGWKLVDAMTGPGALYEASMRTHEQVAQLNRDVLDLASSFQSAALGLSLVNTTTAMGQYAENARADLQAFQELWDKYGDPNAWMDVNSDIYAQNSQIADDIDKLRIYIEDFGGSAQEAGEQIDAMLANWSSISMSQNQAAIEDAIAAWQAFNNSMQRESDWDALNEELNRINGSLDEYEKAALAAKAAAQEQADANNALGDSARNAAAGMAALNSQFFDGVDPYQSILPDVSTGPFAMRMASMRMFAAEFTASIEAMGLSARGWRWEDLAAEVVASIPVVDRFNKSAALTAEVAEKGARATEEFTDAFKLLSVDASTNIGAALDDLMVSAEAAMQAASGLGDALYNIRNMAPGSVAVDLAINTGGAQQALSSGFNAVVGGAQGMGRLADQTAEWATSLTQGNIGQSKLDDLLLKGAISQTTYRRALEANHRIQMANESVQEDVLRIQAKQIPVIASLAEEHARYVDQLADADVATQTVALGYMDTTKASQAMALATLASTSAMAGMQDVAGQVILDMAAADPVLKAMLLDMGLIKEGANGTITMNTDDVVSATDAMTTLNGTLETLTKVLAQAFNIDIKLYDDGAETRLASILRYMNLLDGKSISAYATVQTINAGSLAALGGSAATGTTVLPQSAIDHMLPRINSMSTGGHQLTLVGEAGAELVQLPTGSTVTNAAGTRGRLDPMGRGRRSAGGGDVYNGTVHMTVVRDDSALADRARRIARRRR